MKIQQSFGADQSYGKLYLVPTPIGNLEDMTFRAIRVLKEVAVIAAEDTRNTIKLLNHFEIQTHMISYHQFSNKNREAEIREYLLAGKDVALVSDAGMPCISDPGYELVQQMVAEEIAVVPLPGANAALTSLIASGLVPQPFYFHGFLPRGSKEKLAVLEQLGKRTATWIIYESPHRLKDTLRAMQKTLGDDRQIVISRELTKRYEEFVRGTIAEVLTWSSETEIRGEFCLIVEGSNQEEVLEETAWWSDLSIKAHVEQVMAEQAISSKEAIKQVMKERKLPKREVYAAYHGLES